MSTPQVEIYKSAKQYANFIGDVICNNLAEAFRANKFDVEERELEKILTYVRLSVDQGSADGMRGIELAVNDLFKK